MIIKSLGILLVFSSYAIAATISVNTSDRGYYYSYDYNLPSNQNYITGQINTGPGTDVGFHSFFAFSGIPGVTGTIISATLSLFNPAGGYSSSQSSETLNIDGFSGNVTALTTAGGNPMGGTVPGEYNALASGTLFGTQTVNAATNNSFVNVTLNAAAIAFLNANANNTFAFGGFLSGIPANDTNTRFEFGGSNFIIPTDGNAYLTVVTAASTATPEPQTAAVVTPVLAGLLLFARSRRRRIS